MRRSLRRGRHEIGSDSSHIGTPRLGGPRRENPARRATITDSMSFLVIARERYPLRIGENMLGGRGAGSVNAPALSGLPLFATITVIPGTPASIRAAGNTLAVRVEGYVLGTEPRQLTHGARIEVRDCRIRYGELSLVESTASQVGIEDEQLSAIPPVLPESSAADDFGARLIDLAKGSVHGVPPSGLQIGRDPVCQVVLPSTSVSRQHALIAPSLHGYIITDRSTNGVLVSGTKVRGSQQLGQGDVIRVGEHEFRFEIVAPLSQPDSNESDKRALAIMEVVTDGPLKGARFPVERPVVHIGRSAENDVRIADDSVSGAHATLVRRGAVWHLIDLASTNGTFVEGKRIDGEAIIQGEAELRFGGVKLTFRPHRSGTGQRPEAVRESA
jgi:pSer/pThr/pTyr-binding forkhead associated (FHA) protein